MAVVRGFRRVQGSERGSLAVGMVLILAAVAACGSPTTSGTTYQQPPAYQYGAQATPVPQIAVQPYGGQYGSGTATGDTQEGAAFARWVLDQDPQHQEITDAVVRGDQRLGIKVQPTVTKADVQRLLIALAQGMGRTFPGKPLQVTAFYQSGHQLAEATYDPSTGRASVQFAQ